MATPFQKISSKLVKAKIFKNEAILTYVINDYDYATGLDINTEIKRNIICYPPEPVNVRLIDGKNYLAGDQIMRIPYDVIAASRASHGDDPEIIVNQVKKTLEDMRPFDSVTGGVIAGIDTITFSGTTYRIGAIRGEQWMQNQPADYYFTLRA